MSVKADVLVIGGGAIGAAVAYFVKLLDPGAEVAVVERDPAYTLASTPRASGGVRRLFSLPENIELSAYSIGFFEDFPATMATGGVPADVGLRKNGYLFIVPPPDRDVLRRNFDLPFRLAETFERHPAARAGNHLRGPTPMPACKAFERGAASSWPAVSAGLGDRSRRESVPTGRARPGAAVMRTSRILPPEPEIRTEALPRCDPSSRWSPGCGTLMVSGARPELPKLTRPGCCDTCTPMRR